MSTPELIEAAKAEAMNRIKKASQISDVATITAKLEGESWPVRIRIRADEYFEISGRATSLELYLTRTNAGYLAAIPNFNRCGHVPTDCNTYDVMNYIDIDNQVDAATLAAAIRYLISAGLVSGHPSVSMLPEQGR